MTVLCHRKREGSPVAAACDDDRHLALQRDEALEYAGCAPEGLPGRTRLVNAGHACLPFAVVAVACALQDRGVEPGALEIGGGVYRRVGTERQAVRRDRRLLADTVLGDRHAFGRRRDAPRPCEMDQTVRRHILEFGGDRGATRGDLVQRGTIRVVRNEVVVCECAGRASRVRIEDHDAVTHLTGGENEEAAELPAAEHPECRRRKDRARRRRGHGWPGRRIFATSRRSPAR